MTDVKGRLIELSQGIMVEEDVYRVVEKIRDYDPNLRLKFLNSPASLTEAPYALFELCRDGLERKIFDIWELDDRVLDRLFAADTTKNKVMIQLDEVNKVAKRDSRRRYDDLMGEAHDITKTMLKSPKGTFTFKDDQGNLIKIDDDPNRRVTVEPGRS